MESAVTNLIKEREIAFMEFHPNPDQADTAAQLLRDVDGVTEAAAVDPLLLRVRYNVLQISLEQIEAGLAELGFHLSGRILDKVRRALYYYTEETQRANNGCPRGDSNCTRNVFVNRYSRLDHNCRDPRPEHWRKYL